MTIISPDFSASSYFRSVVFQLVFFGALPLTLLFVGAVVLIDNALLADSNSHLLKRAQYVGTALSVLAEKVSQPSQRDYMYKAMQAVAVQDPAITSMAFLGARRMPLAVVGDEAHADTLLWIETPVNASDIMAPPQGYIRIGMSKAVVSEHTSVRRREAMAFLGASWLAGIGLLIMFATRAKRKLLKVTIATKREHGWGHPGSNGMADLEEAILAMNRSLHQASIDVDKEVSRRTHDLTQALQKSAKVSLERKQLLLHSQDMVERERHRISMEIHDTVGSALVAIKLGSEAIEIKAKASGATEIMDMAKSVVKAADSAYRDARVIVRDLRPELLEAMDLKGALVEFIKGVQASTPKCKIEFYAGDVRSLNDLQVNTGFRTIQEALINAVKHANATEVVVRLEPSEAPWKARVTVADNGHGMQATNKATAGYGLLGMRERISAIDGVLSIESNTAGTVITALI